MKIKSRKQRETEYKEKYSIVSNDKYTRLIDYLGDDLNEDLIESTINRIEECQSKIEYHSIKFTFYEEPIQAHRPRTKFKGAQGIYVPNAKDNHDAFGKFLEKFLKDSKKDIKKIAVPMKIVIDAYYPMPKNLKDIEVILFELEHNYASIKPDIDNVLKAYVDMIQQHLIIDDDIVCSCEVTKRFSLKPRVEMEIIFPNGAVSEYFYNRIKNRKSYKKVSDHIDLQLLVTPYRKKKK